MGAPRDAPSGGGTVTQRVDAASMPDLDAAPTRAAIAFATESGPLCLPALVRRAEGGLEVAFNTTHLNGDAVPERATLLVDDGRYWFELRAVVRRGRLGPGEPVGDRPVWRAFETRSEVAWDYGRLHRGPDGPG
jgi:hypothetical protein